MDEHGTSQLSTAAGDNGDGNVVEQRPTLQRPNTPTGGIIPDQVTGVFVHVDPYSGAHHFSYHPLLTTPGYGIKTNTQYSEEYSAHYNTQERNGEWIHQCQLIPAQPDYICVNQYKLVELQDSIIYERTSQNIGLAYVFNKLLTADCSSNPEHDLSGQQVIMEAPDSYEGVVNQIFSFESEKTSTMRLLVQQGFSMNLVRSRPDLEDQFSLYRFVTSQSIIEFMERTDYEKNCLGQQGVKSDWSQPETSDQQLGAICLKRRCAERVKICSDKEHKGYFCQILPAQNDFVYLPIWILRRITRDRIYKHVKHFGLAWLFYHLKRAPICSMPIINDCPSCCSSTMFNRDHTHAYPGTTASILGDHNILDCENEPMTIRPGFLGLPSSCRYNKRQKLNMLQRSSQGSDKGIGHGSSDAEYDFDQTECNKEPTARDSSQISQTLHSC